MVPSVSSIVDSRRAFTSTVGSKVTVCVNPLFLFDSYLNLTPTSPGSLAWVVLFHHTGVRPVARPPVLWFRLPGLVSTA